MQDDPEIEDAEVEEDELDEEEEDARALAETFTALLREGKFMEAAEAHWDEDLVTLEAMDGPMAFVEGREENLNKMRWWNENHTVHGIEVEGPFVNGDQFIVRLAVDVTPKDGERTTMTENVVYTVEDGRIVEERYFAL
ncbi:nuclear transport factor 2 family protein [Sandaracinobacteroides saxicola]|uniref:Nuclear transport factor 2 family protein n=2 Tax=Sandaracinobacteroides saxicola TaxID=2759707 RepID=A0A7G5IMQ2_9SPHN|nr:nuclear transport factor 2 family protein [Sandaracinobacteroides saxicola]